MACDAGQLKSLPREYRSSIPMTSTRIAGQQLIILTTRLILLTRVSSNVDAAAVAVCLSCTYISWFSSLVFEFGCLCLSLHIRRHKLIDLPSLVKLNHTSISPFVPLSDLSYLTYRTKIYSANLAMVFSSIIPCTTDMILSKTRRISCARVVHGGRWCCGWRYLLRAQSSSRRTTSSPNLALAFVKLINSFDFNLVTYLPSLCSHSDQWNPDQSLRTIQYYQNAIRCQFSKTLWIHPTVINSTNQITDANYGLDSTPWVEGKY
jgi:hypothetical protein